MTDWISPLAERLDVFLAKEGRTLSRGKAREAIEGGFVLVNDGPVRKPSHRLDPEDRVTLLPLPDRTSSGQVQAKDLSLHVLYEDNSCFVIDKPAGIAVHPGSGMEDDEVTLLSGLAHLFAKKKLPFSESAVLVHRLDRDTTGCLLIAKTPEAHRALQDQFESRTVHKRYLALVAGTPEHQKAIIDAPIGRAPFDRTKMAVLSASRAREAKTSYETLGSEGGASLLACDLHTGRTHQIRVHLRTIGHPILGDDAYKTSTSERMTKELALERICLHAWKLSFKSPETLKEVATIAPLSESFIKALEAVGIQTPA
jgi:23S rRNA pseudouridine1911/1915/1917 synthase